MSGIYMRSVTPEHMLMRDQVALANGFQLYVLYSEKQAASFLKCDISTLKRRRRSGVFKDKFPYEHGDDGIRYLGVYIADLIIWETGQWPNLPSGNTGSEITGSPSEPEAKLGTEPGTTGKPNKRAALRWAQQTFQSPKKDSKRGSSENG